LKVNVSCGLNRIRRGVLYDDGLVGRLLGEGHIRVLRERGGDGAREREHDHKRCDEKNSCERPELSHWDFPLSRHV